MRDTLENRMKLYEKEYSSKINTDFIVIRVDGKSFSNLINSLKTDTFLNEDVLKAINLAAYYTALEIQNCVAFYPQSDECSFLMLAKKENNTQHWFDGKIDKINSVTASFFTYYFNKCFTKPNNSNPPVFDCRCFGLPDNKPEEAINYFVWRIKDAYRNVLNKFVYFYQPEELYNSRRITTKQKEIEHYLKKSTKYLFSFPYSFIWLRTKEKGISFQKRFVEPTNKIFLQLQNLFGEYQIFKFEGELQQ